MNDAFNDFRAATLCRQNRRASISTADFERFGAQDASLSAEAREVLEQVLKGYEVIYQVPAGYAREMFQQAQAVRKAQSGDVFLSDLRRPSLLTRG